MAKKFLSPLNLVNLTSDPVSAAEGDIYWNSSNNKLRIYFDGAWTNASGAQGTQGIQGIQGFDGQQGLQGLTGEQGLPGEQGIQGIEGAQGISGSQGIIGSQGIAGLQGLDGIQGSTGAQGLTGTQGTQGIIGDDGFVAQTTPPSNTSLLWLDTSSSSTPGVNPSILTTKGDLFVRDATTIVRLGIGSDGSILTADSTKSSGISWRSNLPDIFMLGGM